MNYSSLGPLSLPLLLLSCKVEPESLFETLAGEGVLGARGGIPGGLLGSRGEGRACKCSSALFLFLTVISAMVS